ncbi:MAG TPA: hypothetical protein IAC15_01375 [Candidatus Onthomonas avicola]|nr:hypothetical protein [Candidatus Onthomonas avicola]
MAATDRETQRCGRTGRVRGVLLRLGLGGAVLLALWAACMTGSLLSAGVAGLPGAAGLALVCLGASAAARWCCGRLWDLPGGGKSP